MKRLQLELFIRFQRNAAHVRSPAGFGDRLRVVEVVLVGLQVRLHKLRGKNPDVVSRLGEDSAPVLRARTRLHRDDTPWGGRRVLSELHATHLSSQRDATSRIQADEMKPIRPKINADDGGFTRHLSSSW